MTSNNCKIVDLCGWSTVIKKYKTEWNYAYLINKHLTKLDNWITTKSLELSKETGGIPWTSFSMNNPAFGFEPKLFFRPHWGMSLPFHTIASDHIHKTMLEMTGTSRSDSISFLKVHYETKLPIEIVMGIVKCMHKNGLVETVVMNENKVIGYYRKEIQ